MIPHPHTSDRARRSFAWILSLLAAGLLAGSAKAQTATEVQITPETMTLGVGQRQPLFATAYDRQGNLIPNARFTFLSSDTLIAKVTREGAVLGVSPGLTPNTAPSRVTLAMFVSLLRKVKRALAMRLPWRS